MAVFQVTHPFVSPISLLGIKYKHHLRRKISMGSYDTNLNGSITALRGSALKLGCSKSAYNVSLISSPLKPISAVSSSIKAKSGASLELEHFSFEDVRSIPALPKRRSTRSVISRASNGIPYNFHNSSITEKPRWWWRTLASIPYLMPIHTMSIFADNALQFLPFLENFQLLTDPFFGAQLPNWFPMVYCLGTYFLVVRRKKWPAFFRFHIVMAMLLDNSVQIIGIVAGWMPYWRKLDAPFWTVVACGFLYAILECVRCALGGEYPNIPLFSEAAHMHCFM